MSKLRKIWKNLIFPYIILNDVKLGAQINQKSFQKWCSGWNASRIEQVNLQLMWIFWTPDFPAPHPRTGRYVHEKDVVSHPCGMSGHFGAELPNMSMANIQKIRQQLFSRGAFLFSIAKRVCFSLFVDGCVCELRSASSRSLAASSLWVTCTATSTTCSGCSPSSASPARRISALPGLSDRVSTFDY